MARLPRFLGPISVAAALIQSAMALRDHWGLLSPAQRQHLGELLRASGGRPGRLSERERRELRELIRQLELARLGRRVVQNAAPVGRRRRG